MLEAAARTTPPVSPDFFYAVIHAQHAPHVRWTAARLLATLYGAAVLQQGVTSDEPLVQDGLDYANANEPPM